MSPKTITCPDCGLRLTVERDTTGSRLKYDFNAWRNRCKRLHLDDPAWCLIARSGTTPKDRNCGAPELTFATSLDWKISTKHALTHRFGNGLCGGSYPQLGLRPFEMRAYRFFPN